MKLVYFTHSLASCWNHGNAHFLRGVLRDLVHRGHEVLALEPRGAWSLENLLADAGEAGLDAYRAAYPELRSEAFDPGIDLADTLADADAVIVHEWNEPALVAAIGRLRRRGARFTLLFHDTHHRAVSDPDAIRAFDLDGYDGVLAFGETLAEVYRRWGWGGRVWVWHEAADTRWFRPADESPSPLRGGARGGGRDVGTRDENAFRAGRSSPDPETPAQAAPPPPPASPRKGEGDTAPPGRSGLVWIGNWGDDERSAELESFLFRPAKTVGLPLDVYGVRYPAHALDTLKRYGVSYRGWLPNARAPEVFARHLATVHVPRRFYVTMLPGIPTIRVFEALACGIPLISAPWSDAEGLFRPGADYLVARDEAEMERHLGAVRDDAELRAALVASGLETIRARHTCAHRADELIAVIETLEGAPPRAMSRSAPLETLA